MNPMNWNRRDLFKVAGAAAFTSVTRASRDAGIPIQQGPFQAGDRSLEKYSCPEWFRNAKFGLWAHWGPSSAIGAGDWYARNMYMEGSRQYQYHLKTYGHPSKFGYKDTIPLWKAERFDPKALARLYRQAGAKYFVSMGVHCDNFDLWNSRNRRWNSVKMGPKRDIVGEWRQAARAEGLRFGVSEHVWGSYNWWETNKGADKQGPYAGVPYDGNDPANRDLYFAPHAPAREAWAEQGNEPEEWKREWFLRAQDLIDQHQPDLYYEDGGIPFGRWGRSLVAHYYNQSLRWHKGEMDVVYTAKVADQCSVGTCVLDVERGVFDGLSKNPFQSDTCVGDWHYSKDIEYKTPKRVIDLLVDIVSRNGNMLLNFPLRPDGTLDDRELKIVAEITAWMDVNSEGIYGTRPWKIYGTGPSTLPKGSHEYVDWTKWGGFNEANRTDLTANDVRFTTKGSTLYAFVMGWPQPFILLQPLALGSQQNPGKLRSVELLGHHGKLTWKQDESGLRVDMPAEKPSSHAITLKIALG
jgi:alpha-L-fucosidase